MASLLPRGARFPGLPALFRGYVRAAVRCPLLFIALALAVPALLASSLLWGSPLVIDTDPNLIWVPPGSTTFRQKALFDAAFDPFFRVSQVFLSLEDGAGGAPGQDAQFGVLQREYFLAALALQEALLAGATSRGETLESVCFRLERGGPCLIQSPLNYFQSRRGVVEQLTNADIQQFLACAFPADFCARNPFECSNHTDHPENDSPNYIACVKDGVPMIPEVVLGGRGLLPVANASAAGNASASGYFSVCGAAPQTARSLVLTLLLDSTPQAAAAGARWEQEVFLPLVRGFAAPGLRASYMAERSISDALAIVDEQNQFVVLVSYAAMFLYIVFALGKFPHPLAMRSNLGLQGIVIVGLSVLSALGVWTLAGGHITMIVNEVVPFLILAIGAAASAADRGRRARQLADPLPLFFPPIALPRRRRQHVHPHARL